MGRDHKVQTHTCVHHLAARNEVIAMTALELGVSVHRSCRALGARLLHEGTPSGHLTYRRSCESTGTDVNS